MDYKNIYNNIITKAKSDKTRSKQKQYFESHHIIPKSLGGQ